MAAVLLNQTEERAVWDSARNGGKLNLRMKEYETPEIYEKDFRRNSRTKSSAFEEKTSLNACPDTGKNSTTAGSRESERNLEQGDYFNSSSPSSKSLLQDYPQHQREQNDFEDEYRPLPSPTRSSLRSPNKDTTVRSKEGYRVKFADKNFSDLSPENEAPDKPLDNITRTRKPLYSSVESGGSAVPRDCRSQSFRNSSLTSTPLRSKITIDNERTKFSHVDGVDRYTEDLKDFPKSSDTNDHKFSSERLLRASTDLYVSTHLNDSPLPSNHLSALRKGFTDIPGIYTLPSKPALGLSHQFTGKERQSEYAVQKKTWQSDKDAVQKMDVLANGMKRSSSLNSLLTPKPVSSYADKYSDRLFGSAEYQEKDRPVSSETDSTIDILQQLMDLVDRYWNGSGSLLQNQRFLVPARELLSSYLLTNRNKTATPRTSYGVDKEYNSVDFLTEKLKNTIEENHMLQSKISKLESKAIDNGDKGFQSGSQDDLWHKYEKLSLQVESLQQQLKQAHKLHDTVNLLHDSQRSLVCTNEYLLQQLNKASPSYLSKAPSSAIKPRTSSDKYISSDSSDQSASSPVYSSGQYRIPERLSSCPL
ncbi:leucine-rich repeat-containing protein 36 isoform X2 [Xenopus laevis]|uniref:Leucine-rich repeat-containing protein 36 isoform X2 n=2 Tax=Xenopus laevis TaxID=8355 RepID=A0A1L8GLC5_XENLA|nr:leucine-rich repeat-containing protein 36 isoform X2 [Xenopus laevis]OCT84644.1 hypothetical protein XELAEV_18022798mg [Xenopus laevis]